MNRLISIFLQIVALPLKLILYGSLSVWDYISKTVDYFIQSTVFEMMCSYYGFKLKDDDSD